MYTNKFTHYLKKYSFIDLLRIYLGFIFVLKGIQFFNYIESLTGVLETLGINIGNFTILGFAHVIIFVHVAGGLFLMFGLLTRLSALLQIPFILGAVIFVHSKEGFFSDSLHFAIFVLISSVLLAIYGSQRFSFDYYLSHFKEHEIKFLHKD